MHFVTADQVHEACASFTDLTQALEKSHCAPPAALKDMLLASEQADNQGQDYLLIRAAWSRGAALGLKAASVFPLNRKTSALPAIQAVYVLYSGVSGAPAAVIDGTAMTYYKTAADSALGGKFLAHRDTQAMTMIGAGAMAPYLIRAHCELQPSIRRVTIWNRTASRAQDLADSLAIDGVQITASDDLATAVREAQLISSATMTTEPIIQGDWISSGAHLDLVGAFKPDMREADDAAVLKSRIFVDSRDTTIGEIGEVMIPIEQGVIKESDVLADLYELCSKKVPGRQSNEEITLFKNGGGGHLDLMVAQYVHSQVANS